MGTDEQSRADLEAENEALRAKVEELEGVLYPRPDPPPEAEADGRERAYILPGFPNNPPDASQRLGGSARNYAQRCMPGVDWTIVDDLSDVPEGELCVVDWNLLSIGLTKDEGERQRRADRLWLRRRGEGVEYVPEQSQSFMAAWRLLLDELDSVMDAAKRVDPSVPAELWLGHGYLRVADFLSAAINLIQGEFKAGRFNYAERAETTVARVHEMLETLRAKAAAEF